MVSCEVLHPRLPNDIQTVMFSLKRNPDAVRTHNQSRNSWTEHTAATDSIIFNNHLYPCNSTF